MECPRIPHNDITPVINKAANRRLNAIFKHFTGSNEQAIPHQYLHYDDLLMHLL